MSLILSTLSPPAIAAIGVGMIVIAKIIHKYRNVLIDLPAVTICAFVYFGLVKPVHRLWLRMTTPRNPPPPEWTRTD